MGKLRPGSDAAMRLLDSDTPLEWEAAFLSYAGSVRRLSQEAGKSDLVGLDNWFRTELPAALRSRAEESKPYLSKEDLVKVVQWKLWIGANRPSLLGYAKAQNAGKVEAKSREAFEHLPEPSSSAPAAARVSSDAVKRAVKTLSSDLKGVGPATASAVLSALCGGCPFDADEVIDAVKRTGKRDYSLKEYLEVHEALDAKAASLGGDWDAERVRRALWSRAMHSRFKMTVPPVSSSSSAAAAAAASPPPGVSSSPSSTPQPSAACRSGSDREAAAAAGGGESTAGGSDRAKKTARGGGGGGGAGDAGGGDCGEGVKRHKSRR